MAGKTQHCLVRWRDESPWLYYTLPLVACILSIVYCSLAPPANLPSIGWDLPYGDKIEHLTFYALLGLLLVRDWQRGRPLVAVTCLGLWLACAGWGFYLELLQGLTGYRTLDLADAAANAAGSLVGIALWGIVAARNARMPRPMPVVPAAEG